MSWRAPKDASLPWAKEGLPVAVLRNAGPYSWPYKTKKPLSGLLLKRHYIRVFTP